ncbi:MAG: cyclic nucleotide-binding domain-containing protein [Elusimicrobia bacterium]|nr:cyclic nucleotide-binding domain-containing protein [Elusimicrobiota bacterium]
MEQLDILKLFPLFNKLTEQELKIIASKLIEQTYAEGVFICQQGEPGGHLYLIKQGEVEICLPLQKYEEKCHIVTILNEGMFFGELSFFDGKEYSANVRAKGEVNLLELKKTDFEKILADEPETAYNIQNKIILNLIDTLRKMNEMYSFNVFRHGKR